MGCNYSDFLRAPPEKLQKLEYILHGLQELGRRWLDIPVRLVGMNGPAVYAFDKSENLFIFYNILK